MYSSRNHHAFYSELESIRGIMAWWVVLGHIYSYLAVSLDFLPMVAKKFLLATVMPVNVFICLSGFVIAAAILAKGSSGYGAFIVRRWFRIFPVYFICLFISIIFFDERIVARTQAGWLSVDQVKAYLDYAIVLKRDFYGYLVLALSLMQGSVPDQLMAHAGDAFLPPAWSLSLEWQFYIVAPALVVLMSRSVLMGGLTLTAMLFFSLFLSRLGLTFSYGAFFPTRFSFFFIGICTAILLSGESGEGNKRKSFLVCLVLALGAIVASGEGLSSFVSAGLWVASVMALVFQERFKMVRPVVARVRSVLQVRALAWIGKISYSTYLIHVFVIDMVGFLFLKSGLLVQSSILNLGGFVCAVVFLTLGSSILVHHWIEKPFIRLGKSLTT